MDIVLVGAGGLVLGFASGFLVAAHNAKQAAAAQSAIANLHGDVKELKGIVTGSAAATPPAPPAA